MKNSRMFISLSIICFLLGIMLAMQFRTNRFIEQGVSSDRAQELTVDLKRLEKDNMKLSIEIQDLEYKLEQAKKGQSQTREALMGELSKAGINAGLVAMTGPGIEIIMDNPPAKSLEGGIFLVRDEDLLRIVNELKGAGAEAISINGQRLIAISEIRQAGSFINVNLEKIQPPFHILAVGNSDKLVSALEINGGLIDYLRDIGIAIKVQAHSAVTVPGYKGQLNFEYAKTVQGG